MTQRQLELCIVSHPVHVGYLSDRLMPPGCLVALLVTPAKAVLVAPASHGGAVAHHLQRVAYEDHSLERTVNPATEALQAFEAALATLDKGVVRVGLEPSHLPAACLDALRRVLGVCSLEDVGPALRRQRRVKDEVEVQAIQQAVATCDRIFQAIEATIHGGCTELDVYLAALRVVACDSAGPAVLDGDFVSGPRAEEIGGPPTARALQPGELLIVDVYPRIGAYWADCTRTYVVGEPSQALLDRHALLEEALEAGEQALEPGRPAREVYEAVKGVLDRAGVGDYFPHHAGHGVGLTASEEPRLIPGSRERLAEGMVVTLEPGLCIPGQGGMRLEDNFLITAGGCRCLSHYPRRLVPLPSD